MLGKDYVEWFCKEVDLPFQLDPKQVWPLFVEAGHRPEVIGAAADRFRFDFEIDAETGPDKFTEEVQRLTDEINQVQMGVIHSLTPIQSSVLRVMAATKENYAPFEAATMEKYRKAMTLAGLAIDDAKADVPGVQQALIALQEKKLVWKAARGVYAIEEQSIVDLLRASGQLAGLE